MDLWYTGYRRRTQSLTCNPEKNENEKRRLVVPAVLLAQLLVLSESGRAQDGETMSMSFFITSSGPGNGADLGGLAGADAHCQSLAEAVGAGDVGGLI